VIRRLFLAAAALVGAASLSSCATFSNHGDAAKVASTALSQHDLEVMTSNDLASQAAGATDGVLLPEGELNRNVLTFWVQVTALTQAGTVTQAQMDAVRDIAAKTYATTWEGAPKQLQDVVLKQIAVANALQAGTLDRDQVLASISGADVHVDSRYGWWNPAKVTVTAFG
jgi:hypothetical protein